ncbi:hypothetical protein M413DRAFT_63945 [Hebeloma cylindrosporum]|uniref:Required for respiratory growth protein 9, mitochondrial n=1 Tax=Hebeloma cylindrosporum TaxID=76867 RepID=A0A0C2YAJ8_HEBCY|nr:hypothetical protein M413DRAFT_63945 [Hebeloma cylindrosporum h7]
MASLLRVTIQQICRRPFIPRYYSDSPFQTVTNKWQLAGVPRPKSILEDDDAVIDLSEDNDAVNGANPNTPPLHLRTPSGKSTPHEFRKHRETMRKAFPEGWLPPRKLSREAMDSLRQLHRASPEQFNVTMLSEQFKISPEAVRRILKSKWEPTHQKRTEMAIKERQQRQAFHKERETKQREESKSVYELKKRDRSRNKNYNEEDEFTFR